MSDKNLRVTNSPLSLHTHLAWLQGLPSRRTEQIRGHVVEPQWRRYVANVRFEKYITKQQHTKKKFKRPHGPKAIKHGEVIFGDFATKRSRHFHVSNLSRRIFSYETEGWSRLMDGSWSLLATVKDASSSISLAVFGCFDVNTCCTRAILEDKRGTE